MDQSESRIFTFHSDDVTRTAEALGTEFCGKKTVCKRHPFAIFLAVFHTSFTMMTKYFLLTCLLFPFVSFIILMAVCQYYKNVFRRSFRLNGCESAVNVEAGIVRVR